MDTTFNIIIISLFYYLFPPYKTCWKCRINEERPTGKENPSIEWDDGGKIGNKNKLILTEIFPSVQKHDIQKYW